MTERRYTDQEVARLLQRAADLDRDSGSTALARGLSLAELEEIAAEVGIAPGMVRRAASEVASATSSAGIGRALFGGPPVVRRTAAIPARLDRAQLGHLVDVVDAEVPAQGTVGEALGSVRWTASNRFLDRQVVLQEGDGETVVRVEERFADRVRAMVHLIPTAYGGGIALAVASEALSAGGPAAVAVAVAGAAAGWGLGRAIWNGLRGGSRRRVEALADRLGEEGSVLTMAATEGDEDSG